MRGLGAVLVVMVLGCTPGGSSDGGGAGTDAGHVNLGDAGTPDAGAPLTASDYCAATVEAFCPYYLRCGRMVADSLDACRATFLETCQSRYQPRYVALEQAGLLSLSRAGVAACAAHLATVECSQQIRDLDGPCASMWLGRQPEGGACGLDVESLICAPGSTCVLGLDLCGTCKPEAALGESCDADHVCNAATASCQAGTCVQRLLPGQDCTAAPCVLGAWCEANVCQAPSFVGEGESCDSRRRCAYRSTCSGGTCHVSALLGEGCGGATACASGACVASLCSPLKDSGEACSGADQCISGACASGHCASYPDVCVTRDGGT